MESDSEVMITKVTVKVMMKAKWILVTVNDESEMDFINLLAAR